MAKKTENERRGGELSRQPLLIAARGPRTFKNRYTMMLIQRGHRAASAHARGFSVRPGSRGHRRHRDALPRALFASLFASPLQSRSPTRCSRSSGSVSLRKPSAAHAADRSTPRRTASREMRASSCARRTTYEILGAPDVTLCRRMLSKALPAPTAFGVGRESREERTAMRVSSLCAVEYMPNATMHRYVSHDNHARPFARHEGTPSFVRLK